MLNLKVAALEHDNEKLNANLGRKYKQCRALNKRIIELEKDILFLDSNLADSDVPTLVHESHSGEAPVSSGTDTSTGQNISAGNPSQTEQITAFADEDAGWTNDFQGAYDETMNLAHHGDSDLGSFLSRPIRAISAQWDVNQPIRFKENVWSTFLNNPRVREKIAHYELIRMKLHARFVISGTKFHYGRAIASYNPLANSLDDTAADRALLDVDNIALSQRPHIFLNPTKNTGGTLDMPFMWTNNYLSLTSLSDSDELGEIIVNSFGPLRHANGGDDPVTITMYLWASDVILTMPTSQTTIAVLESQARINGGDEYGQGIISKPAAAVAAAAGMLTKVPVLRPYALATQMVASGVGQVAKLFGYSRPAVITDIQLFKPNPVGNLANADAADAVHKLTLDSKAELTCDSRTVGLDGNDQMGICDIARRESYITSFTMTADDPIDDMLFNIAVTPNLYDNYVDEIHPTPMTMICNSFKSWQGSIKFRFQAVKSDFHKGKILVRYDPVSHDPSVEYNTNYSRVIDLAKEDDFEIEVGWAQAQAWLNCGRMTSLGSFLPFSSSVRLPPDRNAWNGILEINVLNSLVSPSVDTPITFNVFVSMGEDCRFAAPTNANYQLLHVFPEHTPVLDSQSGTMGEATTVITDRPTSADGIQAIGDKANMSDNTNLVFYGDPPTSLRELFKRYTYQKSFVPLIPGEGIFRQNRLINKDLPYQTGWDLTGGVDLSEVNGVDKLTVAQKGPIPWFMPCFAAYRGAVRHKYTFGGTDNQNPSVVRVESDTTNNGSFQYTSVDTTTVTTALIGKSISKFQARNSFNGASGTNTGVNNTIEVELPYYRDYRLSSARVLSGQNLLCNSHNVNTSSFTPAVTGPQIDQVIPVINDWVAAGEDFTLFFWTGAPIMYEYSVGAGS